MEDWNPNDNFLHWNQNSNLLELLQFLSSFKKIIQSIFLNFLFRFFLFFLVQKNWINEYFFSLFHLAEKCTFFCFNFKKWLFKQQQVSSPQSWTWFFYVLRQCIDVWNHCSLRKFWILAGLFVVFIFLLASEEWVPKKLKQFSIVGRNFVKYVPNNKEKWRFAIFFYQSIHCYCRRMHRNLVFLGNLKFHIHI